MAKYRKYSKEFKLQATKLVTEQGYSCDKAAKRLGTRGWSVRNWIKQFQQKGKLPSKQETPPKIDEIRRLRKELSQLRMENEILKKAAAYFAKDTPCKLGHYNLSSSVRHLFSTSIW